MGIPTSPHGTRHQFMPAPGFLPAGFPAPPGYGAAGMRTHDGGFGGMGGFAGMGAMAPFQPMVDSTQANRFNYDQTLGASPSLRATQNQAGVVPLWADDSANIPASKEELEQMDHELFEPLDSFDKDMQEMMIECINEKVRRILSLDPSKFQNGKLPFGLKPDKMPGDEEMYEQLRQLNDRIRDLEEERGRYKQEAEELRRQVDAMRQRLGMKGDKEEVVMKGPEPTVTPTSSPSGRGRAIKTQEEVESPKSGLGPPPTDGMIPKVEHERLKKAACSELESRMKRLEDQMGNKNQEIATLKMKLSELKKPPPQKKKGSGEEDDDDGDDAEALKRKLAALRRKIREVEEAYEKAQNRIQDLEILLEEAEKKGRIPKEVTREIKLPGDAKVEVENTDLTEALAKSQTMLLRLLTRCAGIMELPASPKGQKQVETIFGKNPGADQDNDAREKAVDGLGKWTSEALRGFEDLEERLKTMEETVSEKTKKR